MHRNLSQFTALTHAHSNSMKKMIDIDVNIHHQIQCQKIKIHHQNQR